MKIEQRGMRERSEGGGKRGDKSNRGLTRRGIRKEGRRRGKEEKEGGEGR